jgi:nucleotide-binding universal stress UspA family protein
VPERPYATQPERLRERTSFEWAGHVRTVLEPLMIAGPARVDGIVEWGLPDAVLREVARRLAAELVVVGSHGRSPITGVLPPGSTSTSLARDAPVPVVLAPAGAPEDEARLPGGALACGIDGSDLSVAAARTAARLAARLGVPLVLVTVDSGSGEPARDEAGVAAAVAEVAPDVEVRGERSTGAVAEELVTAAARHDAGLIVVGSRGRGPLTSALLGSVTAELLRRSDRPVLVVSRRAADTGVPRQSGR